jgi:hypothetical protein
MWLWSKEVIPEVEETGGRGVIKISDEGISTTSAPHRSH